MFLTSGFQAIVYYIFARSDNIMRIVEELDAEMYEMFISYD